MKKILSLAMVSVAVLAGCNDSKPQTKKEIAVNDAAAITASYDSINAQQLAEHVKVLASDEFGGRSPSTEGEKLTFYLNAIFI